MNEEVLVLFSGGKDSFLLTLLLIEKGYNVNLVTFENICEIKSKNAIKQAKRIQNKYGKIKVKIIGIQKTDAIFREFIKLYYNTKPSQNIEKYGDLPISQFNCLSCRLSMYVMSIIIAKQNGIHEIADGARISQKFAIEQEPLLKCFTELFEKNGLNIVFPLKEMKDDFELKNEILIRGFTPKTLEPQCLLGMPLENDLDEETINATEKCFKRLLLKKSNELIEKYKNMNLSGEYI